MNSVSVKNILYILLIATSIVGCSDYKLTKTSSTNTEVANNLPTNKSSDSILAPYRNELKASMEEVINTSSTDMEVGQPEGKLGNFVTDLTLETARLKTGEEVDFCILNNGGLRTPLPKGEITRGKIYELMPFENEIVIVTLKGQQITEMLDYILKRTLLPPSRKAGVPISGIRIMLSDNKIKQVFIGMYEFDPEKTYRVATSDYLAFGGDHMDFFKTNEGIEKTGIKLRDAIIDYIIKAKENGNPINAVLDGRIYYAE